MKKLIAILVALIFALSSGSTAIAADPYVSKWGTFKALTFTGSGDDVIELPAAVKAGFITAEYIGESNFVIWSLDTSLAQSGLLVNTIGSYAGKSEFGFGYSSKKTKAFEVTAEGDWTITVRPISSAPKLTASGSGDGVFKYSGGVPVWKITHTGDSNFIVWQYCTSGRSNLVVNTIGAYRGTVRGLSGTCVVSIRSEGTWTIKK
jgi:hypothetical protein